MGHAVGAGRRCAAASDETARPPLAEGPPRAAFEGGNGVHEGRPLLHSIHSHTRELQLALQLFGRVRGEAGRTSDTSVHSVWRGSMERIHGLRMLQVLLILGRLPHVLSHIFQQLFGSVLRHVFTRHGFRRQGRRVSFCRRSRRSSSISRALRVVCQSLCHSSVLFRRRRDLGVWISCRCVCCCRLRGRWLNSGVSCRLSRGVAACRLSGDITACRFSGDVRACRLCRGICICRLCRRISTCGRCRRISTWLCGSIRASRLCRSVGAGRLRC
mmetsp:Transcript_48440/g.113039  ORF Transcript_48440/g.113039 Transcript_48440/m.113039 type:complete len:272 (+) Transcript_48440:682-1497(+)